jgi:hypothetical protein
MPRCKYQFSDRCTHPELGGLADEARCGACAKFLGSPRGAGDIVDMAARITGLARLVKAVEGVTKKPCGCAARRAALNAAIPFADDSPVP